MEGSKNTPGTSGHDRGSERGVWIERVCLAPRPAPPSFNVTLGDKEAKEP